MKAKMILKKGMVFLFAMVMVLTGFFPLGVMAASGLKGHILALNQRWDYSMPTILAEMYQKVR